MEIVWRPRADISFAPLEQLQAEFKIPQIVARLLFSRGILQSQTVSKWLQPKLSELKDPFTISQMQKAALRVVEAFKKQESIAIYGDFDLDGTSGIALLSTALERMGFQKITLYQPSRLTEGYGLHEAAVEKLVASGVSLIVTVDVGVTAAAAARKCSALGIDLIITDHHLAQDEIPQCFALVNPNLPEEKSAGLGHLCGAGVAFYLAWAIKREMVKAGLMLETQFDLKEVLDCFVIGTLTDMVPILEENRVLVKYGLQRLANTHRPGLKVLLEELSLWGRPLTSHDVAIRFAPKLNALSRMELGVRPLDLFTVKDEKSAMKLVGEVLHNNSMRVNLQAEAEALAMELVKGMEDSDFLFVAHEKFHRGVVGLIATKLCQTFQKPAFVGAISEDGTVVGSARAPQASGCNLVKALESCEKQMVRFGGHALAAGFEYETTKLSDIRIGLKGFFEAKGASTDAFADIVYDSEVDLEEISPSFMNWIEMLGPFGHSFDAPVFLIKNLKVTGSRALKGGHLKLKLRKDVGGKSSDSEALLFSPLPEQIDLLASTPVVDVLAESQWNYYQGRRTVQILIKEIRSATS